MQRVVSINLNGSVYPLEENGYTALFAYLDAFESRLKDAPDRAQLIADIERRIAEKCQACLEPHKAMITTAEVARIISEMDPVPDQPAAAEPSGTAAGSNAANGNTSGGGASAGEPPRTGIPPHKRLCQVREGGMIGGVCLGLATFFNIDVTLVRIVFALFAIVTGGWGILAYLGLMFILPRATSVAEAAAPAPAGAHQWPWDDGWPWDKHGWPWDRHGWPWDRPGGPPGGDQRREWREQRREQRREWREQRRATRLAYGPPPSLFGTLIIVFFLMLAFGWLTYWMRGGFFWGWPVFWGGPFFWGAPHWVGIVLFFMFFRLLMLPFRASRWGYYGHPGYGPYHGYGPWSAMWHAIVWIGTIVFLIWLASQFVPGLYEFIHQFQWGGPNGRFDV
jgi:phage shock protein PspC (stress-responsive transcriptional regulator)